MNSRGPRPHLLLRQNRPRCGRSRASRKRWDPRKFDVMSYVQNLLATVVTASLSCIPFDFIRPSPWTLSASYCTSALFVSVEKCQERWQMLQAGRQEHPSGVGHPILKQSPTCSDSEHNGGSELGEDIQGVCHISSSLGVMKRSPLSEFCVASKKSCNISCPTTENVLQGGKSTEDPSLGEKDK